MSGLVAFSFALGKNEPNPCNVRLADEVERIVLYSSEPLIIVAQWEIAKALTQRDFQHQLPLVHQFHSVERHRQGAYLDSEEVMAQAAILFRNHGVRQVTPVANPFLHLWKCRQLVRKAGFTVRNRKIGNIGFYPESDQWWTRGPVQLLAYTALQVATGRRGR